MDPHDLYGLPLDRFIPERTALVKELRGSGQREQAETVAALRKPSVAAWAVNQLIRTQTRAVAALFEAGDAVQRSQSELLRGRGDAEALRQALSHERGAVDALVEVARGLLSPEGHELSQVMLDRVADTLHAVALDEEARDRASDGCLEQELHRAALAGLTVQAGPKPRSAGSKPSRGKPARPAAERQARRQAEATARRAAERAARALEAAQAKRDAAAEALASAEDELTAARKQASDSLAAHRQASRNVKSA